MSVVGIVDSPAALSVATGLGKGRVDYLEWRADCLPEGLRPPEGIFPWILTVRDAAEGGMREWSTKKREEVFQENLPFASLVDVELRAFQRLGGVLAAARKRKLRVVASFHDFQKTPSSGRLRDLVAQAGDQGADIFKIATRTESSADVGRLLDLFAAATIPLAVMGMGPLGAGSRILFAQCGSLLNYGWLHQPNVPGQWSAVELKRILSGK